MIVIIADYFPDAVRGKLKLWCIEPKPNVFVSGIKDSLSMRVVELLLKYCPPKSGLLIFQEINEPPFYRIYAKGAMVRQVTTISGLQLIQERLNDLHTSVL